MSSVALDVYGKMHAISEEEITWRPSVYGIVIDNDRMLLSPQHGIGYDLPGGGVDMSESFDDAVVREVKEETGIDVVPIEIVGCRDSFFVWKPESDIDRRVYHSVLVYYFCKKVGGEISADGFDEDEKQYAEKAEWVDIANIETIPQASSVDFMPYIRKAIEIHGN